MRASFFFFFLFVWLNDALFFALSGKTYTMVGTRSDPGLMVLSLNTIFDMIKSDSSSDEFEVTCSYLEVYNEVRLGLIKLVVVCFCVCSYPYECYSFLSLWILGYL